MALPKLKIGNLVSDVSIVQGGMGVGISLSGLASAVANEGGIGVIATVMTGMDEPDIAKDGNAANIRSLIREIRKAREMTRGVLGVNIMVALTNYKETVRASIEEGIDVIFSGAGLPLDLPAYLQKGTKTKLVPIVSSGRGAMVLCKKWLKRFNYLPDAFVVEGPAAGGHLGFKPQQIDDPQFVLEKLATDVIAAVKPFESKQKKIPVIVAGGIYSGADIYHFLKLGAAAVQLGTRFVATHECDADIAFKQAYVDAKKEDLVIIQSPVGLPGRALHNPFLDEIKTGKKKPKSCPFHCIKTCDYTKSAYCIALALTNARNGNLQRGFAFAGQNAYRIKEIISVKRLMAQLTSEYDSASSAQL